MRHYLAELLFIIGPARRRLPFILGIFLLAALLDLVGIGMVPAAVTLALNQSAANASGVIAAPAAASPWLVLAFGIALISIFVIKSVAAFHIQRYIIRFSEQTRRDIISRLMRSYLHAPYEFHLARNTAVLVNVVIGSTANATGVMSSLLRLVCDLMMFAVVFAFLLWLNPAPVLGFVVISVAAAWLYQRLVEQKLTAMGQRSHQANAGLVRATQNGVHAYKEVKILGVEQTFIAEAETSAQQLVDANSFSGAIQTMPRLALECILVTFAVGVVLWNYLAAKDIAGSFALLGAFVVAGLRMFPAITQSLNTLNIIRFSSYAVTQLAADLRAAPQAVIPAKAGIQRLSSEEPSSTAVGIQTDSVIPVKTGIQFSSSSSSSSSSVVATNPFSTFKEIHLDNVTYQYPNSAKPAVQNISLKIERGQAIGLMGRSGAGKSTLVDILMGLLEPQEGAVRVDGVDIRTALRGWMQNIAYVPQMVNITDDTLLRNVAFGVPDDRIDPALVWAALEKAQLADFARELSEKLKTFLGDRGIRLSGGQRQRVALARALYHGRKIIVMDEATSALDDETEKAVVESVRQLHGQITLVIIAHRKSTLISCDEILGVAGAGLTRLIQKTGHNA